jgi:hypothetical protein
MTDSGIHFINEDGGPPSRLDDLEKRNNYVLRESNSGCWVIPSHDTNIFFYVPDVFLKKWM